MKRIYYTALSYMILGLGMGVIYREVTRFFDFTGTTKLSLLHTHTLVLGMLFFLLVLLLEAQFTLSKTKQFRLFYWHYNVGLLLTLVMMTYIGLQQLGGNYQTSGMVAGLSGVGHILLAVGLGFFFAALGKQALPARVEG